MAILAGSLLATTPDAAEDERKAGRLMADKQVKKWPQRKDEDDVSEAPTTTKKVEQAKEISAITEDVLEDIDCALRSACGFEDDQSMSDDEFTKRAADFVRNYRQKGGQ